MAWGAMSEPQGPTLRSSAPLFREDLFCRKRTKEFLGERRGSNPRSWSHNPLSLPLDYIRHNKRWARASPLAGFAERSYATP